ncbi:tropomodulin-1-like [Ylistrum balloti]|uniref:tropomodulin-1-like n=1 Tax=Ylistrum balloti TaxID=509963 RepID=UPI0029059417|nr:tropomodulin-1-like [Ylistrum balloti]XP_060075184.1 tropomodulin-1-like [Ylistrum balloti]
MALDSVHLKATKEVEDFDLDDIDKLLSQLTTEEIEELNGDFDPDNSFLPPSQRMKPQTTKDPTGPYKREKLLAFLEKKAKEEKDWEQVKPYVKETRGKIYKPKEEPKVEVHEDEAIQTEWDDILAGASEEELVDLAAVLGFHGMLNQTQYYASLESEDISHTGGFTGTAKAQVLKLVPAEPPNPTDVEESIKKIQANDAKLKSLNLNNIKNISYERQIEVIEGLKSNTCLETLEMANVAMTDRVASVVPDALRANKTLKVLSLESNFIGGDCLVEILKAINENQTLQELRFANQKPEALGNKVEMKVLKMIEANTSLLKFGIHFEFPEPRVRVHDKIQNNNDELRKKRLGDDKSSS